MPTPHNRGVAPTVAPNREGDELPFMDMDLNDAELASNFGLTDRIDWDLVYSYSSNVLTFHDGFLRCPEEPKTPLYFGVELEICVLDVPGHDHIARDVYNSLTGRGIITRDGSVNSGFEIVTVPATLNYHKSIMWNEFFGGDLTSRLVGMPYCGNHIHVSKAAWTPLSVGKLLSFIHNEDNNAFLDYIAKRGQGSYCTRNSNWQKPTSIFRTDHYRSAAVNVLPAETIEFRLFRSSITPANLYKNLEFIDAIRMFTFHHKISDMQYTKFLEFLKGNDHLWPYLINYMDQAYPVRRRPRTTKPNVNTKRSAA